MRGGGLLTEDTQAENGSDEEQLVSDEAEQQEAIEPDEETAEQDTAPQIKQKAKAAAPKAAPAATNAASNDTSGASNTNPTDQNQNNQTTPEPEKQKTKNTLTYQTHVQRQGWQNYVKEGATSGTSGKSLRLEGIRIKLEGDEFKGSVQYKTHVQTYGWQGWKKDGELSGTTGKSKRLEAIQIKLTGELANKYDIYYRVHAQSFGWMGWAKNGESAGTEGYAYRLEAIQVKLVTKGGAAPGSTSNKFQKRKGHVRIKIPTVNQGTAGYVLGCEGVSLYMALKGTGHIKNMNIHQFMRTQPSGRTPKSGYSGNPRYGHSAAVNRGKRTTIWPAPTARWAAKYGNSKNLAGSSLNQLKSELSQGHVVIVWVTSGWATPWWKRYSWGKDVENNHVLCVVGYRENGDILVNDCHDGRRDGRRGEYWVSAKKFNRCYNARHFAISVW